MGKHPKVGIGDHCFPVMQMTMAVDRRREDDIRGSNCEIDGWGDDTDIHVRAILGRFRGITP